MEEKTKKGLIIGGSVAAAVLLIGGITAGIMLGGSKVQNTISSNDFGIGAFSNLESFNNDGFNNGVLRASTEYLNDYKNNDSYNVNKEKSKLEQRTSGYDDSGISYVDPLIDYFSSNDIIISAGFQVANAINGEAGFDGVFSNKDGADTKFANSSDKAFVLMDDTSLSAKYNNAASVSFAAEGAGYMSSTIAYIYTQYDAAINHKGESKYTPNIVMWGGKGFDTVYDYMSGFAQGIKDLNTAYAGKTINGNEIKNVTLWSGGDTLDTEITTSNTSGTSKGVETWYTNGFTSDETNTTEGGAVAKAKSDNAINNEASVIFAVAGGNTSIAEKELINSSDSTTKLLGVDSDATIPSAAKDDLYLASAQKNLIKGGQIALWGMDDFDNDGIRNFVDDIDANDDVGKQIKDHESSWKDTTASGPGLQLRGTAENGGVGVIFGSDASAGMNSDLAKAMEWAGIANEEALHTLIDDFADGVTIDAANPEFVSS